MGSLSSTEISTGAATFPNSRSEIFSVPLVQLLPGDSPRLEGEDKAHALRLASLEAPLPPILVDRRTMRVIDGIHRLMAASIKGQQDIDVWFFDGTREDAFLKAVESNVEHGLPLTQADRTVAALRILKSHPSMSDRAIAKSTGLGSRAVAELRRSTGSAAKTNFRIGRDGKVRPLNGAEGRLRVAELIRESPEASLRQVARAAGVSPATVLDVRRRLARGEEPASHQGGTVGFGKEAPKDSLSDQAPATRLPPTATLATLEKLMRDPSLRQSELGRRLLRMLKENELGAKEMSDIAASVPSHSIELIIQVSRRNSQVWEEFAQQLKQRARTGEPEQAGEPE